ncbi:MAG: hypothetical protein Q4P07_01825 [Ornithinimicrobium sp.]|uniref:HD-GYP domain-containing protein n=1 Tax=Ornithinimicrobium sp. TaxID=1977084 RepID=UPI0026E0C21A|nr:HD domain-containing phosphohydrolase [Ornithinimicrobium sp.]MDO5738872.1 hypothetical protein [Ornithinimicrobium sp.]
MTLTLLTAIVAFLAMVLGEAWRLDVDGQVRDAPIAQATAIALVVATSWPAVAVDEARSVYLGGLLGPLLLAVLATLVVGVARQRWATLRADLTRSGTTILVAGGLSRIFVFDGRSLHQLVDAPGQRAGLVAMLLLVLAILAVGVPLLARSVAKALAERAPVGSQILRDLTRYGLLSLATATTAVVMALSLRVLGPISFVLFLVPMAVLLPAVSRQRTVRAAQRQTLFALARLTDHAGLTAPGHATRVAALSVPIARDVGVDDADLLDVETAALLHDVGQVGLRRPIPGGATTEISTRDQRRVAAMGAAILSRTAELSRLAAMVADVGVPQYRAVERGDVLLGARVVRVVSAYDDLTAREKRRSSGGSARTAMERLLRATPREFDPDVVRALLRQLERRGELTAAEAAELRASAAAH